MKVKTSPAPHLLRRLLITLTVAGALTAPAVASATTIQTSDTSHQWQAWTDQAQVPTWQGTLPLTIDPSYFDCGGFPDAAGCTSISGNPDGGPIVSTEINGGADTWTVRGTLYHELGQVFWAEYMTAADEDQFMQIVGLSGDHTNWGNWAYTTTMNDYTFTFSPFEWFAEAYRLCATWGINQPVGSNDFIGLGYPGLKASFAAQQRETCRLIDQVGADNGIATPAQAIYSTPTPKAKPTVKPKPRPKTRVRIVRPRHLHGSGFNWGVKRIRVVVS